MCTPPLSRWHSDALQEYQRRSELLAMARTQANKTKRRLIDLDVAKFNQSRADNIKVCVNSLCFMRDSAVVLVLYSIHIMCCDRV